MKKADLQLKSMRVVTPTAVEDNLLLPELDETVPEGETVAQARGH